MRGDSGREVGGWRRGSVLGCRRWVGREGGGGRFWALRSSTHRGSTVLCCYSGSWQVWEGVKRSRRGSCGNHGGMEKPPSSIFKPSGGLGLQALGPLPSPSQNLVNGPWHLRLHPCVRAKWLFLLLPCPLWGPSPHILRSRTQTSVHDTEFLTPQV